jgi:hypothetical protein
MRTAMSGGERGGAVGFPYPDLHQNSQARLSRRSVRHFMPHSVPVQSNVILRMPREKETPDRWGRR